MKVIKKTIQKHMLAIFALILEYAIFGYQPFPHFSRIPIWRMSPVVLCYRMSKVMLFSLQFKFVQNYSGDEKIANHKRC